MAEIALDQGWVTKPLSHFVEYVTYGFTNPMPTVTEGPYLVTARDVAGGVVRYDTARRTTQDAYDALLTDKSRPRIGDVLITKDGSIGRVAVCDRSNVCINQSVAAMRPKALVVSEFLAYLLQSPYYQELIERDADGSTIKHIYITRIAKMPIGVPSLVEQHAIVGVLGALDDKIAANTKLASTADELASTLVAARLDRTSRVRLGEVATIVMGSSPAGETLNELGDGVVFYQGVRDFGTRFPTNRVWTSVPTRMASPGDLLLSVRAPVGQVNLAPESLCVGRGLAAVRAKNERQLTLFHVLKGAVGVWEPFEAEGTIFGSINREQINGLLVPIVPEQEADALEGKISALESVIASALAQNRTLAATRDTLLPQLMSGKLRVRDAERIVSEVA